MEQSKFKYLEQMVDEGRVRLTLIISPPRCGSTAIAHAISRSPSHKKQWYVHEPKFDIKGYEQGAFQQALKHEITGQNATPESPLHITIKTMPHDVDAKSVHDLAALAQSTLLLTRDPLQQVSSLIKINKGEEGNGKRFDAETHEKSLTPSIHTNQFSAPRNELAAYFDDLTQGGAAERTFILDGDAARLCPEIYIKEFCKKSGLTFDDSMLKWDASAKLYSPDAWCSYFKKSTGLEKPIQRTLPPPLGNPALLDDISHFIENYTEMLCSPHAIKPAPLREAITAMQEPMADGIHPYHQASPVAAYAMIASYNPTLLSDTEKSEQEGFLKAIRKNDVQGFARYFNIIDKTAAREFPKAPPSQQPSTLITTTNNSVEIEGSTITRDTEALSRAS